MLTALGKLDPRLALRWGVWLLFGLLVALGVRALTASPAADENPAYLALSRAHTRRMVADARAKDSLTKLARQKRVQYVAAKEQATKAVEDLPPAKIVGVTLSLPEGEFVLVPPVAKYVGALQHTVAVQSVALAQADTALAASEQARAAGDSVSAGLALDRDRWKLTAESLRPSGGRRLWDRVKVPLAFGAGLYVGARAVR